MLFRKHSTMLEQPVETLCSSVVVVLLFIISDVDSGLMWNLHKFEVGKYLGGFSLMKNVILIIIINLWMFFLEGLFKMKKSDSKSHLLIVTKVILLLFNPLSAAQINWLVSIWGQHWHLMG